MAVKPQPEGYFTVTPTLIVDGAAELIEFMKKTFGASERMRMDTPEGKIAHSEYMIGDSAVMIGDATEVYPPAQGYLHVYVDDCDAVYQRALNAGATTISAPEDHFYGDRAANVSDRWGNRWTISTHVEDVTEEDMTQRMESMAPASS